MAQQVNLKLIINGERVTPFAGINITQDVHRHHTFEIALPTDAFRGTGTDVLEQSKQYVGQECYIAFGGEVFRTSHHEYEFTGVVTEVGLSRFGNGDRSVLLRGHSPTILMDGQPQCRSYTEMTLKDIVEETLKDVPQTLHTDVRPQTSDVLPYVVQYNESNYDFIQRLAATYGEWCCYDGVRLVYGPLLNANAINLPLAKDLFNFDFTFRLQPLRTRAFAYNYLKNEVFESRSQEAKLSPLDEFGQFSLDQSNRFYRQEPVTVSPYPTQDRYQLNDRITQQQADAAHGLVVMSGNSDNPHLTVGTLVDITGEATNEHDHGKFIITSVSHSVSGTLSYQNSFTAIPAEMQLPPPPPVSRPVCESQRAVVTDNEDPEKLGRIRVRFLWQPDGEATPWVRIVQPYAGKGERGGLHGFYFIPEIGTEVLVGFEHHNPDLPFVMGNVYHGESSPRPWFSSSNASKVIRTRNGNEIRLVDSGGQERIHIYHRKNEDHYNEIKLDMEGEGTITIETKGQLDLKAKNISLMAEESITLQSGTQMKASAGTDYLANVGRDMNVEVADNLDVAVGKSFSQSVGIDAKLNAANALDIKATQISLEADTELSAEANLEMSIKGGTSTKVSSGGVTSVKGAMVKIN